MPHDRRNTSAGEAVSNSGGNDHRRLSAPFRKCTKTAVVEVLVTFWHLLRYLFDSLSSSPPDGLEQAAPIKMRQFIFTHTSGPVPRHAVLGVGGCPITRGRGSARGLVQCRRGRTAEQREPVVDPLSGQALVSAGPLVPSPAPRAQETITGGEASARWRWCSTSSTASSSDALAAPSRSCSAP